MIAASNILLIWAISAHLSLFSTREGTQHATLWYALLVLNIGAHIRIDSLMRQLILNINLRDDVGVQLGINILMIHVMLRVGDLAVAVLPSARGGWVQGTNNRSLLKYTRRLDQ